MTPAKLRAHLQSLHIYERLRTQSSYRSGLRAAVRGYWAGVFDFVQFHDDMENNIRRGYAQAWKEGMKEAGLDPAEITPEEQEQLDGMIYAEIQYIIGLAQAIEANVIAGGALAPLLARVDLWVPRYNNVRNQALQSARTNPVLMWEIHAQESCASCLKLSGQRRRASVWQAADIRPQHPHKLDCMISAGGPDVCKCALVVVEGGSSRGRLPKLP